jgi:Zinc knuckle
VYIQEFNTLRRLTASVATLDPNAVLRYFMQELHMNIRIGTAAAVLATVKAAQVVARAMDLVLEGQCDVIKSELMDTFTGQYDEKPRGTCNWCGYKDHFERECRQKAGGKPRKVSSSNIPNTSHRPLKCFHCGRKGHRVADCKAKIVFSAEESELESNKKNLSYFNVYGGKGVVGGLSEIRSVLREEGQRGSHGDDLLSSLKSILLPVSKPTISPLSTDGSSEMTGVLRGKGRKGSHGHDSLSSPKSILLVTSKSMSQPIVPETSMKTLILYDSDEDKDMPPPASPTGRSGEAIFTLEDGSEHDLKDILSVIGNHAISVKSTFHGKPINILVDTGCDIVCVSSCIALCNEWKKVHDLKVHGFNGRIVNYLAKTNIEWKMGDISSTWKNAWVLPAMTYDIIISTDWIEK